MRDMLRLKILIGFLILSTFVCANASGVCALYGVELFNNHSQCQVVNDSVNVKPSVPSNTTKQKVAYIHKQGYRVRFFISEGSNRLEKSKTESEADRFHVLFPYLNVYVLFSSPRWVSEAGDFETKEQAQALIAKMGTKNYNKDKLRIVKTIINILPTPVAPKCDQLSPYILPETSHPFQSIPE